MPRSKQKDNRYRAKVTVGHDADGKPIVKYASGRTARELEANKAALRQRYIDGLEDVRQDVMYSDYVLEWYRAYKEPGLSASSKRNYECILSKYIIPELGDRQVRAIRTLTLQGLANSLVGKGETTITYVFAILTGSFKQAYGEGIINRNPTVGLIKPAYKSSTRRALTDSETKAVLNVGASHPDGLILLLLYYTGIRRGEMLALRWSDIDFQNMLIRVSKDIDFVTNSVGNVKTENSVRDIPMPKALAEALNQRRGIGEMFVIQSVGGSFLSSSVYTRKWYELMEALYKVDNTIEHTEPIGEGSELPPERSILTAHYFRHNYASVCYNAGVDVLTAQKYLGHSDPKTTLDIYSHLNADMERQSALKLLSVFDKKVAKKLPGKRAKNFGQTKNPLT